MIGDILQIEFDSDNAATLESGFYSYPDKDGANNLGIDTSIFPKFLVHYKTSSATAALGAAAKVVLAFNGYNPALSVDVNIAAGDAQEIMTNSFSTEWTTETGTITTGKTLDHILLFAECDTTAAVGKDYVYYDFVMVHKGTFDFPFVPAGGVHYETPYKTVELDVPGRDGGILQRLGMKSPMITVEGNMRQSEDDASWKAPAGELYGNTFYSFVRGMLDDYREPFHWFTSDLVNCKVIPDIDAFRIGDDPDEREQRVYSLRFKQHSLSPLGVSQWDGLEWAGKTV